jgi:hypothetical protein
MTAPAFGPLDVVVLGCTDETMPSVVDDAIADLAASTAVDVIDIVQIHKDHDGSIHFHEVEDLSQDSSLATVRLTSSGLTGHDDLIAVAEGLDPGSCAVVFVVEHTWARDLVTAVRGSSAYLLAAERVPAILVNEIIDLAALTES